MPSETVIELKEVAIYQDLQLVLNNINLEIKKGEFVYIIGKVGSGKTSLLKTLYCDLPLKTGSAEVTGYQLDNIRNKDIPFLRRKLGIVFQDFQLLTDRTIYDNLLFVLKATGWKDKKETELRIIEVLEKVGLRYQEDKMPHQLSGGEQQRVVIARALLNDPEILLVDEPTGNLDPETSEGIMKLLFEIRKSNRAIIMATHNYQLIKKYPAKTLKCEKGYLIPVDPHNNYLDYQDVMH